MMEIFKEELTMCFTPSPDASLSSSQQFQSQQYCYPQPQSPAPFYPTQFQQPYYQLPGIPLHILIQQIQESRTLAVENVQLHNRLAQKELTDTNH